MLTKCHHYQSVCLAVSSKVSKLTTACWVYQMCFDIGGIFFQALYSGDAAQECGLTLVWVKSQLAIPLQEWIYRT